MDQYNLLDRNERCFSAILFFYQSDGILSCPGDIPLSDFIAECEYFELPERKIELMKQKSGLKEEAKQRKYEECSLDKEKNKKKEKRSCLYYVFGFCILISSLLRLASIVVDILLSTKTFRSLELQRIEENWVLVTEFAMNCWFLLELFFRYLLCSSKRNYFKSKLNWIDAIAIVPYFALIYYAQIKTLPPIVSQMLRIVHILRIMRVAELSSRLKIVAGIIAKIGFVEIIDLFMNMFIFVLVGASGIYYLEASYSHGFESIPDSLWWAIITISTVGYGDVTPVTAPGQIFASVFIVSGLGVVMLPLYNTAGIYSKTYMEEIERLKCMCEKCAVQRKGKIKSGRRKNK